MKMMPGVTKEMRNAASNVDENELSKIEAIIHSMTSESVASPSSSTVHAGAESRGVGHVSRCRQPTLEAVHRDAKMMKQMSAGTCPRCPAAWVEWRVWPPKPARNANNCRQASKRSVRA